MPSEAVANGMCLLKRVGWVDGQLQGDNGVASQGCGKGVAIGASQGERTVGEGVGIALADGMVEWCVFGEVLLDDRDYEALFVGEVGYVGGPYTHVVG